LEGVTFHGLNIDYYGGIRERYYYEGSQAVPARPSDKVFILIFI